MSMGVDLHFVDEYAWGEFHPPDIEGSYPVESYSVNHVRSPKNTDAEAEAAMRAALLSIAVQHEWAPGQITMESNYDPLSRQTILYGTLEYVDLKTVKPEHRDKIRAALSEESVTA